MTIDAPDVPKRPNIVFVLTDDQGYGDLGCHGNPIIQTPAIDAFHGRSLRFTQFHVGTTCAPTRSGLLTGLNCNSAGVWHTIGGAALLRQGIPTLPEVLGDNGYATALFGKWHLGDDYPYRPQDRGFQETVYHRGGGLTQVSDHWGNNYIDDTYLVNGVPKAFKGYCTDVFFGEALKWIEGQRAEVGGQGSEVGGSKLETGNSEHETHQPFFCMIAPNAPHTPYNVEKKYRDLYAGQNIPEDRKRFYGMISNIDQNFQTLENRLRELGLEENTILIFMTDNGSAGGMDQDENQFLASGFNAGMRGRKASAYEGGHRVPFFLRWPAGGIDAGRDIDALASYTDIMPTLLDFCGIDCPEVEGTRLFKDLAPTRSLVTDTQRLPHPIKWRLSCVMKNDWRLINGRELYDLSTDPEQRTDISADHPDTVAELRADYEAWWALCSRQFNEVSPSHIGSDRCAQVDLTTMEMRNDDSDVVWHQGQVRAGQSCLGWWDLFAETAGTYELILRRWPEETGYAVRAGIDGVDIDPGPDEFLADSTLDWYRGGRAIDISGAALKIDEQSLYMDLEEDAAEAVFTVELTQGAHTLRAWFSGGNDVRTATVMAPYYVTIRKK
jgi:arylsulfatase A-like enzyme